MKTWRVAAGIRAGSWRDALAVHADVVRVVRGGHHVATGEIWCSRANTSATATAVIVCRADIFAIAAGRIAAVLLAEAGTIAEAIEPAGCRCIGIAVSPGVLARRNEAARAFESGNVADIAQAVALTVATEAVHAVH